MPGNKNSGRKSVRDERLYIKFLEGAAFSDTDLEELQKKINRRRYSVLDMMLWRALQEDGEKDRLFLMGRLIPEKMSLGDDPNAITAIVIKRGS